MLLLSTLVLTTVSHDDDPHYINKTTAFLSHLQGFKATLEKPNLSEIELQTALAEEEPPFSLLTVSDLVPIVLHAEYEGAGGDVL